MGIDMDTKDIKSTDAEGEKVFTSLDELKEIGSQTVKRKDASINCLVIIGHIEGHQEQPPHDKTTKYEHVLPTLAAIEESDEIDGLLILLNTVGGDIEAGLAIAELIAGMSKPTVSLVLGGGHSIGVPLAVAAKVSFIAASAAMTLHPVRLAGVVTGSPQTYAYFERIQERIVGFISRNSHTEESKLREMMLRTGELTNDIGTVLYGEEAVKVGLIDRIGGLSDALSTLHKLIDERRSSAPQS